MAAGDRAAAGSRAEHTVQPAAESRTGLSQNSWLDGRAYWKKPCKWMSVVPMVLAWQLGRTGRGDVDEACAAGSGFCGGARAGDASRSVGKKSVGYSAFDDAAEIAGLVSLPIFARNNGRDCDAEALYEDRG